MRKRYRYGFLAVLALGYHVAAVGQAAKTAEDRCGVDNHGWNLGDITFHREIELPGGSRIHVNGIYIGNGKHLVVKETMVGSQNVAHPGSSHLADVPRKPGASPLEACRGTPPVTIHGSARDRASE